MAAPAEDHVPDQTACPVCAAPNREDAVFCRACGARLAEQPVDQLSMGVAFDDDQTDAVETIAEVDPGHAKPTATGPRSFVERIRLGSRRRGRLVALVALTALVATLALVATSRQEEPESDSQLNFATVRRTRIVAVRSLNGEVVARGEGPPVLSRLSGTLTDLAVEGAKVERGEALFDVDGQPVLLLYGAIPAWRDIGRSDSEPGADVEQLEENLKALGFDPGDVDDVFTADTEVAVNGWLASLNLPQVGVIRLGRAVFVRAALTIARQLKPVGAPIADGDEVLATVSSEKVVRTDLELPQQLAPGDVVTIAARGQRLHAKVVSIDATEREEGDAPATALVAPDEADALAGLPEGSTVSVEVPGEARDDVLVVPVTALIGRRGGGYAVEVDRGGGRIDLVAVTPGLYAVNQVEIEGDVEVGDRVVVP